MPCQEVIFDTIKYTCLPNVTSTCMATDRVSYSVIVNEGMQHITSGTTAIDKVISCPSLFDEIYEETLESVAGILEAFPFMLLISCFLSIQFVVIGMHYDVAQVRYTQNRRMN